MTESKINGEETEIIKTFDDLLKDVIDIGDCCACGACVAYCESQSFDVIKIENQKAQYKSDKSVENCTKCGICYFICPQTKTLKEQLQLRYLTEEKIGKFRNFLAAKTTDPKIAEVGQNGGVVTSILSYLFDTHEIDAAIVSEHDEKMNPISKLVFKKDDLLKSSGTRYLISSQVLQLKDIYNIPQEVLEEQGIFDIDQMPVAFVGTPCQCKAIYKMKLLSIKPAHVVKYVISLFCFENFEYDKLIEIIKEKTGLNASEVKGIEIKGKFFVIAKDGTRHELSIRDFDGAVRNHCLGCEEFTGRFSDLSIGSSGAPKGHSVVVIRTKQGEKLINSMIADGRIEQYILPAKELLEWKQAKYKLHKRMVSFKVKKKKEHKKNKI